MGFRRTYPIGAEVFSDGTHFRLWSPTHQRVDVVIDDQIFELQSEDNGYFSGFAPSVHAGARYRFRLSGQDQFPDPASRFQPQGPDGPSQIIDPYLFKWTDHDWHGRELNGSVIYEMHIGTFTSDGTFQAAIHELPELAEVGINCIEVMPVAEFAGEFGWGYDGVNLFAPSRLYGTPDDFRNFINEAHRHEIAVILDVVYNHLGPIGNHLANFSPAYFTDRYKTDWGSAINFDGELNEFVREFYLTNVAYWIREFHIDGLRLDATQNIYDASPPESHILTQIADTARNAAVDRSILISAESEVQYPELCRPVEQGGNGLDAVWNDDYHHSAMVALTGRQEAYYTDYKGTPQEFISAAKYGYLFQGQWYAWQDKCRGRPGLDLHPRTCICFLQNHDQIANSGRGLRAHQLASPALYRTFTALTLLLPNTPLLFQGQEFASSSPFLYFADFDDELRELVQAGRVGSLKQFPSLKDPIAEAHLALPHDRQTFLRCKLDFGEREKHASDYRMIKDLLKLRRLEPGFQPSGARDVDGAVLASNAFVLRYFFENDQDRLLVVNMGHDLNLANVPEPLLAPPIKKQWKVLLSTEDFLYGGSGRRSPVNEEGKWFLPAQTAIVLEGV